MINRERMVDEFKTLVSIDSPSYHERQMGDYLSKVLKELGLVVKEDQAGELLGGNCGNIYAYLEGDSSISPLLFCCHMDTVEPAKGKKAVVGTNGVITSAGETILGADDLAGVVAILESLKTIQQHNLTHRPIEVLFTIAEEVYCKGAAVFDYQQVQSQEAYVLDLTGPVGGAAYKAPTFLSFTIDVIGKSAHAGFAPEKGVHAIAVAAKAIDKLILGRVDTDTTVNIGVIDGGLATNIVPESCIVKGEIRSYSQAKSNLKMQEIEAEFTSAAEALGATIKVRTERHCDAYEVPLDHQVIKRFEKVCERENIAVHMQETFGGSDNNHMASKGITGIVLANAMNQCHSCQEYTTVDELERISKITLALMTEKE